LTRAALSRRVKALAALDRATARPAGDQRPPAAIAEACARSPGSRAPCRARTLIDAQPRAAIRRSRIPIAHIVCSGAIDPGSVLCRRDSAAAGSAILSSGVVGGSSSRGAHGPMQPRPRGSRFLDSQRWVTGAVRQSSATPDGPPNVPHDVPQNCGSISRTNRSLSARTTESKPAMRRADASRAQLVSVVQSDPSRGFRARERASVRRGPAPVAWDRRRRRRGVQELRMWHEIEDEAVPGDAQEASPPVPRC